MRGGEPDVGILVVVRLEQREQRRCRFRILELAQ
jgi:hypothetical protein